MDYYHQGAQSFGQRDPYAPQENREQRIPVVAEEVIKLSEKVMFPIEEYPGYNFIGRLIGPKGSTLKGLQSSTKTKMSILGKGSTKDKKKEEELRKSDDPEHAHLKEPPHVLIQVQAPKIEAHRKMSAALKEVYKYMVPEVKELMPEQIDERHIYDEGRPVGSGEGLRRGPPISVGIPPSIYVNDQPSRGGGGRLRGGRAAPPPTGQYGYNDASYEGGSFRDKFNRVGDNTTGTQVQRFRDSY